MIDPTTTEIISIIANLALALSLVVGLVFGIAQVRAAARDRRERLTLETLRQFQTRDFAELMHHVTSNEMPKTFEEMQARPPREQVMFIQFAQQMESLGILVAEQQRRALFPRASLTGCLSSSDFLLRNPRISLLCKQRNPRPER